MEQPCISAKRVAARSAQVNCRHNLTKGERHTILRWLEIDGFPQPKQIQRVMKRMGFYTRTDSSKVVYHTYTELCDGALLQYFREEGANG